MSRFDCRDCFNCKTQYEKFYCKKDFWVDEDGNSKTFGDYRTFNTTSDEVRDSLCRGCENFVYMGERVERMSKSKVNTTRNNSIRQMIREGKTPTEISKKYNLHISMISKIKWEICK